MRRRDKWIIIVATLASIAMTAVWMSPTGALSQESGGLQPVGIVAIGEDVVVDTPLDGSVQVLSGTVTIRSRVNGDVIAFGANVSMEPGAAIDGDLFCLGGVLEGVTPEAVGGDIYAPASVPAAVEGASKGGRTIVAATSDPFSLVTIALKLSLLLVWLFFAVGLVLVEGREIRTTSLEVRVSPFYSFFLGLIAFTSFILTAIVFSYLIPYVVGLLLLVVLALFAVVTKVYGMIAIFHAIGTMVAGARTRERLRERRWLRGDLAMVVIGLLLLGTLRMIPVLGNAIWMTASLVGVGVALLTRFGRRDPAFLAWRPAEEESR